MPTISRSLSPIRAGGRSSPYAAIDRPPVISSDYARKVWTLHEFRSALSTALREDREYILPIRFDDTELDGLDEDISYLDAKKFSPREAASLLVKKLCDRGVLTGAQQLVTSDLLGSRRAQPLVEALPEVAGMRCSGREPTEGAPS